MERKHRPLLDWQRPKGPVELWIEAGHRGVGWVLVKACPVKHWNRPDLPARAAPVVHAPVDHDPTNPGRGAIGVAQGRELAPREEQHLLRHVACVIDPDNCRSQAINIPTVPVDEPLESLIPSFRIDLSTFGSFPS